MLHKLERLHRAANRAISGCLSSSPISLLISEASLPPPQVSLTHFARSSYERALCIFTSFPISGLARLGVQSRLCRSCWKALASTHPLMLPSSSSREALFASPSSFPWNQRSFTVECTLSSLFSHSDPLSLVNVRLLLTLTLSCLPIWCFGETALFIFLLSKENLAHLPTALSVALKPFFPFQKARCG